MDLQPFLNQAFIYAVVGASDNIEKYGYKVFRDLHEAGWNVVPVNPKRPIVFGVQAAASLTDVQPKPDVAVFVVPPDVGMKVMSEAARLGIKKLWFQPGAESKEIIARARELASASRARHRDELEVVADGSCIMVERHRYSPG